MTTTKKIIAFVLLITLGVLIYVFSSAPEVGVETQEQEGVKRVKVSQVNTLGGTQDSITAYGQVVSTTGVDVIPEINGVVQRVYKRLGSTVRAGEVVVELQNATQAQSVAQARASLASAEANLSAVLGGADSDVIAQAQSTLSSQQSALAQAERSTLGSLDSLYASLESILTGSIDPDFFRNVNTDFPDLKFEATVEINEEALERQRASVKTSLEQNRQYGDVDRAVDHFIDQVDVVDALTDTILLEISKLEIDANTSLNTIESWQADLSLVTSQLASLTTQAKALEATLNERRVAVEAARTSLEEINAGADSDEIAIARAQVAQAEASLQSAQIAFDKTRITAPVFGTISDIDLPVGSLVGPGAPVFSIANEQALRIDTNVTTEEARRIQIGDEVTIDGEYLGFVSVVSPNVNSSTGKVAVQVLLSDQELRLPSGSGVGLIFGKTQNEQNTQEARITIPIEAIFVRGDRSYIYVVEDDKAVAREISTPSLFGASVVVSEGLESTDTVILNARGVKDNESVEIINN